MKQKYGKANVIDFQGSLKGDIKLENEWHNYWQRSTPS